ncbi:MAG TPA: endonuclease domain-containing protein [Candidatus Acidoferrales bacterium]|nr:endonuclease domain-containing protein [Candidatus Acidoferrales bacterium]
MKQISIIERARELRKNRTPSEEKLWVALRNRKLHGLKFLRQHPITYEVNCVGHFFIADFYCAEKRLVVELDGKIHDYQKDRDAERELIIRSLGLRTLHIKNEELDNIEQVKQRIENALTLFLPLST